MKLLLPSGLGFLPFGGVLDLSLSWIASSLRANPSSSFSSSLFYCSSNPKCDSSN